MFAPGTAVNLAEWFSATSGYTASTKCARGRRRDFGFLVNYSIPGNPGPMEPQEIIVQASSYLVVP